MYNILILSIIFLTGLNLQAQHLSSLSAEPVRASPSKTGLATQGQHIRSKHIPQPGWTGGCNIQRPHSPRIQTFSQCSNRSL